MPVEQFRPTNNSYDDRQSYHAGHPQPSSSNALALSAEQIDDLRSEVADHVLEYG